MQCDEIELDIDELDVLSDEDVLAEPLSSDACETDNASEASESDESDVEDVPNTFGSTDAAFRRYLDKLPKTQPDNLHIDTVRITRVLWELMVDRGYTQRVSTSKVLINTNKNGARMGCFIDRLLGKLGVVEVRSINTRIDSLNLACAVIVSHSPVTVAAAKLLSNTTIVMQASALTHNYTQHAMVPKHERVADPEKLMKRMHLRKEQLPKISCLDPIVQWYGWQSGTVIKIHRVYGGVMEPSEYYRLVCNLP
jgi:DNA-directed RNA polymerase subunit H (RpoH/RPB5)